MEEYIRQRIAELERAIPEMEREVYAARAALGELRAALNQPIITHGEAPPAEKEENT